MKLRNLCVVGVDGAPALVRTTVVAMDSPTSQHALTSAGLRAVDPPFTMLVWSHEGCACDEGAAHTTVDSMLRWDDTPPAEALVQLSFLVPATGVPRAEFDRRYRAHAEVARRHHPGIVRYVQHLVADGAGAAVTPPRGIKAGPVAAVSELWFRDEEELATRYWADETSRDAVRADNSPYVDFERTWSVLCRRRGPSIDLELGFPEEDVA